MIKIVHIVASLIGGAGEHVFSLLEKTDRDRFKLYLVAPDDFPPLARRLEGLDVTWFRLPIDKGFRLSAFRHIHQIIKREKMDIVHSHGIRGALYGRLGGLFTKSKSVYTIHGFHPAHYKSRLKKRAALTLERFLAKHATDKIICVSHGDMKEVETLLSMQKDDKLTLIPNGVDLSIGDQPSGRFANLKAAIQENDKRKEFITSDGQVLLGTVGRLRPQKSMATLVDVAALLKQRGWNFRLLIVGEGFQERILRERIIQAGLENEVLLTGYREDVAEILRTLDVFLLPSLWEGLPLVLLEALAVGVPIVATRVSGTEELLAPVYGDKMAQPLNPESFVVLLEDWKSHREQWNELSQEGLRHVSERYEAKNMVKMTEKVYNGLLNLKESNG